MFAVFLLPILLLSACAPAKPNCESDRKLLRGLVTDIGKINDRSFNQSAWKVQQAQQNWGRWYSISKQQISGICTRISLRLQMKIMM